MKAILLAGVIALASGGAALSADTSTLGADMFSPALPAASPLAVSATYDTGLISTGGLPKLSVSILSTQPGTLSVTRYADPAGLFPLPDFQGFTPTTATIAANTPVTVPMYYDRTVFTAVRVQFVNNGSSAATVTPRVLLSH